MVHNFAGYAWIPVFFVMLCLWGLGASTGFHSSLEKQIDVGRALAADILCFGAIVFASASAVCHCILEYFSLTDAL